MNSNRAENINYDTHCTVCVMYVEGEQEHRLVYERPQMQLPIGPLTSLDRIRIAQFQDDSSLTVEARLIFADLKRKGRVGSNAKLSRVFIARTAAAALEMGL